MDVSLRELQGNWSRGFALHKHTLSSVFMGNNEFGHPVFDTTRTGPGEALYQLKFKADFSKVDPLAEAIFANIVPLLGEFGLIVPMPATNKRNRQPVSEIAEKLSKLTNTLYADRLLLKNPLHAGASQVKNLATKSEKADALVDRFVLNDKFITNEGKCNALLVDDLYDTGASAEAACEALARYAKIDKIFLATCTWK